jgi:NTE family protein
LGGGAAKGYAHIGIIKTLEAAGFTPDVVAGTSAGSVVGAMYAAGLSGFDLQEKSFVLDETQIRDLTFGSDGVVRGEKLQEYVNQIVANRPLEKLARPFAAVATDLDSGDRIVFRLGNVGQAVRASCSIPGVFQPTVIRGKRYVDGGVVSPVPVDAARELGADIVIAVDISAKAQGGQSGMVGIVNQTIVIMGQKLGSQELARADLVVRPKVGQIGATDFSQKQIAILEGEKAMQAALPKLRDKIAQWIDTQQHQQALPVP